jgi:hypothetical protein
VSIFLCCDCRDGRVDPDRGGLGQPFGRSQLCFSNSSKKQVFEQICVHEASSGLQLFQFNGAAPTTKLSDQLYSGVDFDQVEWDDNNHLYAYNSESGQLHLFTVTGTSLTNAPGSPYLFLSHTESQDINHRSYSSSSSNC